MQAWSTWGPSWMCQGHGGAIAPHRRLACPPAEYEWPQDVHSHKIILQDANGSSKRWMGSSMTGGSICGSSGATGINTRGMQSACRPLYMMPSTAPSCQADRHGRGAHPKKGMTWVQCIFKWRQTLRVCKPRQPGCSFDVRGGKCACTKKLAARQYFIPACLPSTHLAGRRCHFSSKRHGLMDLHCD